jgi:hypothetical protein
MIPYAAKDHTNAWKNSDPNSWSLEEVQDFLKESPWAHTALIHIPSDYIINGHPGSGGVMKCAVRWESAPLLRHALMRIESKEYNDALARLSRDCYVIAVVSVGSGSANASGLSNQWSPEQLETRSQEKQAGLFSRTGLLKRDDATFPPTRMLSGVISQGPVDLFLFSRALALETGSRELTFDAAFPAGMGRASISVKFSLKDLAAGFQGGL